MSNKSLELDCLICGDMTDHYPVRMMDALVLECEPCMLSRVD